MGAQLRIRTLIDRNWPSYDYPAPLKGAFMDTYRAFSGSEHGMKVERFEPGRNDQIVQLRAPAKYPGFEVRNVAANGEVWTGVGTATRRHFPDLKDVARGDLPSENMCSIAFRMSYGKFDYFAGGDITGIPEEGAPAWHDVETPGGHGGGSGGRDGAQSPRLHRYAECVLRRRAAAARGPVLGLVARPALPARC